MVDGQFAPLHDKIKAAITAISPLPIKYLINTHIHGDHTGGNETFAKDGASSWRTTTSASGSRPAPPTASPAQDAAAPPDALPKQTYVGGTITSRSAAARRSSRTSTTRTPTATPGSISPTPTCSATGDTFNNLQAISEHRLRQRRRHPRHDRATEAYLKLVNDDTKIVPGHGALATKADVAEYRDMLVTARDRIESCSTRARASGGDSR